MFNFFFKGYLRLLYRVCVPSIIRQKTRFFMVNFRNVSSNITMKAFFWIPSVCWRRPKEELSNLNL